MAARKTIIASVAIILLVTRAVQAQHYPDYNPQGGHNHTPFIDPMTFESDFTLFDPISKYDLMDVKPKKRANYGFYGTYDRMRLAVTRPNAKTPTDSGNFCYDWGWGNRYDFGYMTEDDSGWLFNYTHLTGPGAYDIILRNRVDLIHNQNPRAAGIPGLVIPATIGGGGGAGGGAAGANGGTALTILPSGLNDTQLGYRVYREADSLNVIQMSGFEMNRTWRLKPYQHGGILEPFIGLRHVLLTDIDVDSTYLGPSVGQLTGPVVPIRGTVTESFNTLSFDTDNRMYGGQLGFRYFRFENRWTLSTDFRVVGLENYWKQLARNQTVISEYTAIGATAGVQYEYIANDQRSTRHDNEFVVGLDLRAEAAYQVTKGFTLRSGVQFLGLETGIMRGDALATQTPFGLTYNAPQDIQMFGFTFGATINR